ncbi:MAG: hypothetical protein KGR16_06850 [Verrucomicrobia bacterium]|nr:hypothetical protein [Verrucomicrobiota bacterium]MDE3048061.1 hypothetical protein [Verrucomicrobiota bacterium]
MVNVSTILAALFCATAPISGVLAVEPAKTEVSQMEVRSGKERISAIRSAYQKGEYKTFLKEMDESYKRADLSGLIQMRQKQVPVAFQEKWEERFLSLQKERNQALMAVLSDTDDSAFAKRVRAATVNLLTPEQEKAFSRLNSFIAMAPNTGSNADENKLIDIDLEYEYKILHANVPGQESDKDLSLVLRMEKMDKMVAASKTFQDSKLKQAVGIASDVHDSMLARNLDGNYLNGLLKSKVKPANETEEKALAVLALYQEQFSNLMKDIDHANR